MKENPKKEGKRLTDRMVFWVISHPWLKLISLILAVLVWFYINKQINKYDY